MKKSKGFTLIEVVIVLVIMAIIAALAGPSLVNWIDNAQNRNCRAVTMNMLDEINSACNEKRFSDDGGDYFETVNDAILGVIKFYANNNTLTVKSVSGKFTVITKGICPHGGTHTIAWYFNDTFDESGSHVISSTILVSVKCDRHNDEYTLDTTLGIKNNETEEVVPPGLNEALGLLPDITKLLEDVYDNASGNTQNRAEAFLEALSDKIANDPIYSKYLSQADIDAFDAIVTKNPNKNHVFDDYIIDYLFYLVITPQIRYSENEYPVYISIQGDRYDPTNWLFYANDGYGGTNTQNYANIVCIRTYTESGGVTVETKTWYKYTGGYLNLSSGNLDTNDKMAKYINKNSSQFTLMS